MRYAAALLRKVVDCLAPSMTAMLVRGKEVRREGGREGGRGGEGRRRGKGREEGREGGGKGGKERGREGVSLQVSVSDIF